MSSLCSSSGISDINILLDGLQGLDLVQIELGGLLLIHESLAWSPGCTIFLQQVSVTPDARSSIWTSDCSWSTWIAMSIGVYELSPEAVWLLACCPSSVWSFVWWAFLATSSWSTDFWLWIAWSFNYCLATISIRYNWVTCWALASTIIICLRS